jgi:sugar O-acyltransferase (sialic acid O-acetyltransferase NeuD family)
LAKKVIILGGLGNGSVIATAIKNANNLGYKDLEFAGFLNDRTTAGDLIDGHPVLGKLSDINNFLEKDYYFINTILRIDGQKERLNLFYELEIPNERLAIFVYPTSYIAPGVEFSPGTVIMPHVSVLSGTRFGLSCLVMVGSIIGENNVLSDFCHIAAQSCLGTGVKLGIGVHIGLNTTIKDNISIGDYSTLGMGSVLNNNVNTGEIWAGSPAKFLRYAE